MIFTIAWREYQTLFLSPLAWTILAVMQVIFGLVFFDLINSFIQQPDSQGLTHHVIYPMYGLAAFILLFVIPLLTMRLISEERRNKTLTLLFSAPISMTEIVFGKYLGIVLYLLTLVGLLTLMPLSLLAGGVLDFGLLVAAILGLVLILISFAAIGLFMSTLTQSPTLAAITTFGALFVLWIFEISANWFGDNVLSYLSIISHYVPFLQGLLDTADVVYYLSVTAVFLVFSIRRLEGDRLGG